jgi:type III secretion system low calcium response chaperone LcrH/SycD
MQNSQSVKERVLQETFGVGENFKKLDNALGEIGNKMFRQGVAPKDALELNSVYLENLYAQAYRLYNTGKYSEASHLFRILIMLNAMEPKYSLGLAACFHMLKEYYNAIQTYTMCAALDPQTPIPHYHSSDCFIQMKDYLSAMLCLELAIEHAGNKPEYAKIKERSLMSLESLKQLINSNPELKR